MAEDTNGTTQPKKEPAAEPSMERRLLVAFLLMGAVLFLTPYFYRTFVPLPPEPPAPAEVVQPAEPAAGPAQVAAARPALPAAPATPVTAQQEEISVIETDLYRIALSNRGGVVRSWMLKQHRDSGGKPLELVNAPGAAKAGSYPFALAFRDETPAVDLNEALYATKTGPDGLSLEYEFSDGTLLSRKTFRFENDSYLAEFSSSVTQNGAGVPHLISWRGGFGDAALHNAPGLQHSVFFDPSTNDLVLKSAKDARNGALVNSGNYSFAGVEDHYFAAVFLPRNGSRVEVHTFSDTVPTFAADREEPHVGVAVGGEPQNRFALFVGPKDVDLMRSIDPRLTQLVDFGWFSFLAKPLFVTLNWFTNNLVHNYGWSIVLVTVIINFLLLPLKLKSMRSMKRMQALQPQIAAINARYKNVGLRDPRKAEQNQEVMALYKKHGINPLGGCLPMLLQIPFFIAFYKVLTVAIEMRGASWLWVTDLSQPEHLPIRILPVAMVIAQFAMQKMTPNPTADRNQQRLMMMMPLIFGFMFYSVSSGLVLYWLTSNLVGIVQQYFINRTMPVTAPQQQSPAPAPQKQSQSPAPQQQQQQPIAAKSGGGKAGKGRKTSGSRR